MPSRYLRATAFAALLMLAAACQPSTPATAPTTAPPPAATAPAKAVVAPPTAAAPAASPAAAPAKPAAASPAAASASPAAKPAASPAAGAAAAAVKPATLSKEVSFRIGHTASATSLLEQDAQAYLKLIGQVGGGKLKGQSFPGSQLGKQQELVEQTQLGALEMVISSSEFVSVVPEFGVFDLPFAFKDRTEVKKAVEGALGKELSALAEKKGLVILGYWENGFRQITNNKRPIRVPDDLKGLKIRTPPNPDRVKMFNGWGANAAPLDFSELFSALQTGVFDGQENPMAQITSAKLYEAQKYLSFSGHVYTPTYLVASKSWFDGLEPEAQRALRDAAVATGDTSRAGGEEFDRKGEEQVKAAGVEVNKDVDKAAFQRTSTALYTDYTTKFGSKLVDLLKQATGS